MIPNQPTSDCSGDIIFESCPNPMWIYDLDTLKFLKVNQEAVKKYGYSKQEFLDMTLEGIRPKKDAAILSTAMAHIDVRTGTYKESYFRHRKKDGTVFPVRIKSNLISYNNKRAELVVAEDISESSLFTKQYHYNKRLFQCIADISNNLIRKEDWLKALGACFSILGDNLKIDRAYFLQSDIQNASITLKLYQAREGFDDTGLGLRGEYLPFPLLQILLNPICKGRKLEQTFSKLKSEAERDVFKSRGLKSLLAIPIMTQNKVRGVIGLEDCQLERKWRAEEQQVLHVLASNLSHLINQSDALDTIRASERKFRSMVQNGTDLISILNEEGKYLYASPTFHSQLGHDYEALIGRNYFDGVHPYDASKVKKAFKESSGQDKITIRPYRFKDAEGNWKWVEAVVTNHTSNPNICGLVVNKSDVTDEVLQKFKKELVLSITNRLGGSYGLKDFLHQVQEEMEKATECTTSEIWLKSKDETVLLLNSCYLKQREASHFPNQKKPRSRFERNQGFPGRVWAAKAFTVWDDLSDDQCIGMTEGPSEGNVKTVVGIPIINVNEFLGCMILYFGETREQLALTLRTIEGIGDEIGGVVKEKMIEQEYRSFFEISPDPFCMIGYDGKIKMVNKACTKLLGFPREQFIGERYETFIHESDCWKITQKFIGGVTDDNDMDNDIRMVTASKEERWFAWSGTINREQKLIFAVAKDITQLKQVEMAKENALNRLRRAQRLGKLGYWYRNIDSDISEWSPETYAIYGYVPDDFIPTHKNVVQTFHPDDRYLMEDPPDDHLEPNQVRAFEHRIITAQESVKWVHQEIHLVTDEDGAPLHIEGTVQDITERKEYEKQLEESNKRFRLAMLASSQIIWEVDLREGSINYVHIDDDGVEQVVSEALANENSWVQRVHPEDRDRVWNELDNKVFRNEAFVHGSMEYRIISKDGTLRQVLDKYRGQRDLHGNLVKVIGTVSDITKSMIQLTQIQKQNQILTEIAWLQSHEVRGPLTRIMALLKHYKLKGDQKIAIEDLLQMISISVYEIDKKLHKIIAITESK